MALDASQVEALQNSQPPTDWSKFDASLMDRGPGQAGPGMGDDKLHVRFFTKPRIDPAESDKAQRPIYKDTPYVEIMMPGDKHNIVVEPVWEQHKSRFPQHWALFQAGEAEQVVSVRPTSLSDQEAVREAELVRYVTNRETYDATDNAERIPLVDAMSQGQAQASLRALWNKGAENYPPDLYGRDTTITVRVRSLTVLDEDTAQVRFVRRLEAPGLDPVERDFVATVGFAVAPRVERTLDQVWRNPLGFTVTGYRVDAETLNPRGQ